MAGNGNGTISRAVVGVAGALVTASIVAIATFTFRSSVQNAETNGLIALLRQEVQTIREQVLEVREQNRLLEQRVRELERRR